MLKGTRGYISLAAISDQLSRVIAVEEKDIISLLDAQKSTSYLDQLGYSLKKLVWEHCISGFSHVRLVVGEVVTVGRGRNAEYDFRAVAYDMVSEHTHTLDKVLKSDDGIQSPWGGSIDYDVDNRWWANHYFKDDQLRRVSRPNTYQYARKTRARSLEIKRAGNVAKALKLLKRISHF